jgi:glucan phosphoethanolaminetransferase (alkaline phosphatase superfamily)
MSNTKNPGGFHEFIRKSIVSLKRSPQTIPMVFLAIAFLIYSLNLTHISDSTAKIQGQGMGFSGFVTMLFSLLSFVCFLNSFPRRKKPNILMLVLFFLMLGCIIYCDIYYGGRIVAAITREESPISPTGKNAFVAVAQGVVNTHMILVIIGAALLALLPAYAPIIRKINTNIDVAGNSEMGAIDISGEDA